MLWKCCFTKSNVMDDSCSDEDDDYTYKTCPHPSAVHSPCARVQQHEVQSPQQDGNFHQREIRPHTEAKSIPSPSQGVDDDTPWKNTERTISLLPPPGKSQFGAVKQPRRASSELPPAWPGKWNSWNPEIAMQKSKHGVFDERHPSRNYQAETLEEEPTSSQQVPSDTICPDDILIEESADRQLSTTPRHSRTKREHSAGASRSGRPLSASSRSTGKRSECCNGRPRSAGERSNSGNVVQYKNEKISHRGVNSSHKKKRRSSVTKYLPIIKQKKIPARRGSSGKRADSEKIIHSKRHMVQESFPPPLDDTPLESFRERSEKHSRKRSFMVHGMTVVKTSDDRIELTFDKNYPHLKDHPDLIDEVMMTLVGARERFSLNADEIGGIIKNLEPIYRRRILIQQLQSKWYIVLLLLLLLLGMGIGLLFLLGQPPPEVPSPRFRPPPPITGEIKILSAEGLSIDYYTSEWGSNQSILWSETVLAPIIASFFERAKFPLQNITVGNLTFQQDKLQKRQIEGRARNTPKPVVISYTIHHSENESDYYGSELQVSKLVRSLRKSVFQKKSWKVDPKVFYLRQGNTTVNASTTQGFLAKEVPPLDLFSETDAARFEFDKISKTFDCEELRIPKGGIVKPLRCEVDKKHEPEVICTFSCEEGLILRGSEKRVCLGNGVWSGEEVECAKPCQVVAEIPNGVIIPPKCTDPAYNNTILPDTRCLYTCNTNYALVGALQRICLTDGTWSASLPVCKRECPILKPPAFGQMSPPSCFKELSKEGDVCTFACDDALVLQGESATSCDSDGKWTEDVPVCRKKCVTSDPVMNAEVHPDVCLQSVLFEGMSCTYTCLDGFRLVGNSVQFCTTDERWSASAPQCLRTCPPLRDVLRGSVKPISCTTSGAVAWEVCYFSCDTGYVIEGRANLTCIDNGQWDYIPPVCLAECPTLAEPPKGMVSCSGVTEDSSCVLHCLPGYRIRGPSFVVCQPDGSWTEPLGECIGTCSKVPTLLHGSVDPAECSMVSRAVNDTCTFSCDYSFEFSGSTIRKCLENGSWSGVETTCNVRRQYLFVLDVDMVDVCLTAENANAVSPVKKNFKTCKQHQFNLWSLYENRILRNSGNGKCIGFEEPASLEKLIFMECNHTDSRQILHWPSTTKEKYTVKIRDHELYIWYGYATAPEAVAIDKYNRLTGWLLYDPDTKSKTTFFGASNNGQCPQLSDVPNGGWFPLLCSQGSVRSGIRCTFVCTPGYDVVEGEPVVSCVSGLWNGNVAPMCVRSCISFNPYYTQNGTVTPAFCINDAYVKRGATCTFTCDEGYELVGEMNSACLVDGQWSSPQPQCQKRCLPISIPKNGHVEATLRCPDPLGLHEVGNECSLGCVEGYVVEDSRNIVCEEIGMWNDTKYKCIRACSFPESPHMGSVNCSETLDQYPHGTNCSFSCEGTRILYPKSAEETTCLKSGTWNIKPPECQEYCSPLTAIANGEILPSECVGSEKLHNGVVCTYVCNLQYTLSGEKDVVCLAAGEWSSIPPTCEPDLHFNFIQKDNTSNQQCIIVKQYPHHNTHIVTTTPNSECLATNSSHMWSFTIHNQIRSASTGWCLGVEKKAEAETVKLLDCDSSDEKQRWECVYEEGKSVVKLENTNFLLESRNSFLFITENEEVWQTWETKDQASSIGRICGMQLNNQGNCAKLSIPQGGTISLHCHNPVPISSSCTVTCDADYELLSGVTTITTTCNNLGVYDETDIYCRKRKCKGLVAPNRGVLSSATCNANVEAWNVIDCTVACNNDAFLSKRGGTTAILSCLGNGKWSEPVPACLPYCPQLTAPSNGYVTPESRCTNPDTKQGETCEFGCDVHYRLVGAIYLYCFNGVWNGSEPVCQKLTGKSLCPRLQAPNFGYVTPTRCLSEGVPANMTCTASCLPGFSAVPVKLDRSICQPDGKWSSPLAVCKKVCSILIAPRHAALLPAHCTSGTMTEGHTCTVVCASGYALINDPGVLTCQFNGQWDRSMPRCQMVPQFSLHVGGDCASVSEDDPESFLFKERCFDDEPRQQWEWFDLGRIRNVATQRCIVPIAKASYSAVKLADCATIKESWQCPYASNPADFMVYANRYTIAYATRSRPTVIFVVDTKNEDDSWVPRRSTVITARNKTTTGRPCAFRRSAICPFLPAVKHGFSKSGCAAPGNTIVVGTKCVYACRNGYSLTGTGERICLATGRWDDMETVFCKRQCSVLPLPEFSSVVPSECSTSRMAEGARCTFQCDTGYNLAGFPSRVCRPDGSWSNVPVICHRKCQALVVPELLVVEPGKCTKESLIMGTLCTAHCPNGYELFGSSVQTCMSDGSWSGDFAECLRSCAPIAPIQNGKIMPKDCIVGGKKSGDTCVFSCDSVYSLKGIRIHTCTKDGLWSGDSPECLKTCPTLNPPSNGFVNCERKIPLVGDVCEYSCLPDYVISDEFSDQRTCLGTSLWSGDSPACVREHQFVLLQTSPPNIEHCLSLVDVKKPLSMKQGSFCDFDNTTDRWAWYKNELIRHSVVRQCLAGHNEQASGNFLVFKECDTSDSSQKWECGDPDLVWFIRLKHSKLLPLFSILANDKVILFNRKGLDFAQSANLGITTHTQWHARTALSNRIPVCSAKQIDTCPSLYVESGTLVTPQECTKKPMRIGIECYFTCSKKFKLNFQITYTACLKTGHWSHEVPKCIPACEPFKISPLNTLQVSPPSCAGTYKHAENFACRFTCPVNYQIIGNSILTCQHNSEWNSKQPYCKATCPSVNHLIHGRVTPSRCIDSGTRVLEGTVCKYECLQTEHIISGVNQRRCMKNGKWNDMEPRCIKPCPAHEPPEGGTVVPARCAFQKSIADTVCAFRCGPGLIQLGSAFRVCMGNGTWSEKRPQCQATCPVITPGKFAVLKPTRCGLENTSPGHRCHLDCNPGFEKSGNEVIECSEKGTWSGNLGECIQRCPKLKKPAYGQVRPESCLGGDLFEEHECTFSCDSGYILRGSDVRACQENGNWTGNETVCDRACPPLRSGINIVYEPENCEKLFHLEDARCRARCMEGTVTRDGYYSSLARCRSDGEWDSKMIEACYPACSDPLIFNGQTNCTNPEGGEATTVYASGVVCCTLCEEDYIVTSPPISTCVISAEDTSEGYWYPKQTQCTYEPDPMIIVNRLNFSSVCLGVKDNRVFLVEWENCRNESFLTRWVWQGKYLIRNAVTGLCMSVPKALPNRYVTTSICNSTNPFQHWDCSRSDPYGIILSKTELSISTAIKEINGVILTIGSKLSSQLYTYNPYTENEVGTLCSRRSYSTCSLPDIPRRAQFSADCIENLPTVSGSQCTVLCPDAPNNLLTCQEDGTWLPGIDTICKKPCSQYEELLNNAIFVEEECYAEVVPQKTVCTLGCPLGYILLGEGKQTQCTAQGSWKRLEFYECKIACKKISELKNGFLTPKECITGSCTISCNPGYRIDGPKTRICEPSGLWSEREFECVAEIQFSIVSTTKYKQQALCLEVGQNMLVYKQTCLHSDKRQRWRWNSHYTIENVVSETCLAVNFDGNTDPVAVIGVPSGRIGEDGSDNVTTLKVTAPVKDMVTVKLLFDEQLGSKVVMKKCSSTDPSQRWTCGSEEDLFLQLIDQPVFLDSGPIFRGNLNANKEITSKAVKWVAVLYTEERNVCAYRYTGTCKPLADIFGGTVSPPVCKSSFIVSGTRCVYTCTGDFTLEGDDITTCTTNGKWSRPPPFCLGMAVCKPLKPPRHLLISPVLCTKTLVAEGHLCHMTCDENTEIMGESALLCGPGGVWNGSLPQCNLVCPALHPPLNGSISPRRCEEANIKPSQICESSCDQNFTMVGEPERRCLEDGTWDGEQLLCKLFCPILPILPGGDVSPESCLLNKSDHGMICEMSCNYGTFLSGQSKLVCDGGNWTSGMPNCLPDWCERLVPSPHATDSIEYEGLINGAVVSNSVLRIRCLQGYTTLLPPNRICLKKKLWSVGNGTCEQILCPFLPTLYHGQVAPENCTSRYPGNHVGLICYFTCSKEYSLYGPSSKECLLGGVWSDDSRVECRDTHRISYTIMFSMVLTKENSNGEKTSKCLQVKRNTKSTSLANCRRNSPYQSWRWFGKSRIQNIASQLCLSMTKDWKLILDICTHNKTSQDVQCGDITSVAGYLRLKVGGVLVGETGGTTTSKVQGLKWSASWISFTSKVQAISRIATDEKVPICTYMCGGNFTASEGDFSTPDYPNDYPSDVECVWIIQTNTPKHELQIDFSFISLESENITTRRQAECQEDILLVTEGRGIDGSELEKRCSSIEGFRVTSLLGPIRITFYANNNNKNGGIGFSARWSSIPWPQPRDNCGSRYNDEPIKTTIDDTPSGGIWQTFVVYRQKDFCNAFIISNHFVITNAHCVEQFHNKTGIQDKQKIFIVYDFSSQADLLLRYQKKNFNGARKIWLHPDYFESSLKNDLALIMTHREIEFNLNTGPICLPNIRHGDVAVPGQSHCWAIQWIRNAFSEISATWDFTRYSYVKLLSNELCFSILRRLKQIEELHNLICAEEVEEKIAVHLDFPPIPIKSSIENDEGCLLQCHWNSNWYLNGVHSFTLESRSNRIFVFTNIKTFQPWIDDITYNAFYYLRENAIF